MNDWTSIINQLTVVDIQAQIIRGPANQAAFIGDTAIFNCSMDCSNQAPVSWYFTLPSNLKAGIVSPFTQPNQIKSIYGMEVSRRTVNECPQGGYIVEQFLVTASRQLNLMPVQCSTLSDGGCGKKIQVYFSITALLKVAGESTSWIRMFSSVRWLMLLASQYIHRVYMLITLCTDIVPTITSTPSYARTSPTPSNIGGMHAHNSIFITA